MARVSSKPGPIVNAITLGELRTKTGIIAPPLDVVLARYGFDDEIGVDLYGEAAVDVEVAARFLSDYAQAAASRQSKLESYKQHLREKRAAEKKAADRKNAKRTRRPRAERAEKAAAARRDQLAEESPPRGRGCTRRP